MGGNPSAVVEDRWVMDNPVSRRWPLYTRGNVGEVFPEVVLPLTWDLLGRQAELGWRDSYRRLGLLADDDFAPDEDMVILGVFGGYCYINASYVRMLGVRAPGATVEVIDQQFFGESDAPPYVKRKGDRNLRSTLRLGRTLLRLLRTTSIDFLSADQRAVDGWVARYPGDDAPSDALLAYLFDYQPLFRQLFGRHIDTTFAVALVSGALFDLCAKAGRPELLVSVLGGIGDVDSAEPSAAMWALARHASSAPPVDAAFDAGVDGLLERLGSTPEATEWVASYGRFIEEYGSRGPNEWDLGSDPWEFRPELALCAIDRMRAADDGHDPAVQRRRLGSERDVAVGEVRGALNRIDRWQFDKALRATTLFSQARERTKTTVIRATQEARRAHHVLADRAARQGGPAEAWKSCLLTFDEFRAFVADPPASIELISRREALHARQSGLIPPFIIDGVVPSIDHWEQRGTAVEAMRSGDVLRGIAGCPGIARGRARVVLDPCDPRELGPGDVLVAPITDPSWTPLFLAAEAVVVDVGATMSHAVIVSRELGIPCVVSALDATRSIPDGALIEVDGNAGTVAILEGAP